MRLLLPLPPNENQRDKGHWATGYKQARRYKTDCWLEAIQQVKPTREPPERVAVQLHYLTGAPWDEDALGGAAKWVLDALKLKQQSVRFRMGFFEHCGYFVDDNVMRLKFLPCTQEVEPRSKGRGVLVTIKPLQPASGKL